MDSQETQESRVGRQPEPRKSWTAVEDALLAQLRHSRAPWGEIARRLGRTEPSCKSRLHKIMAQARPRGVDKNELTRLYDSHKEEMWSKVAEKMSIDTSWTVVENNHWSIGQADMARRAGEKFLSEDPVNLPQLEARLAEYNQAQVQSQQQVQQQSTHKLRWSGDEEAILLAKYRADLKWSDISIYFPERTTKACEVHYSFLLERCGGWSPELQNELCKVYKRLKQAMWIPIGEAMSVSWERAEEMHWKIGKDAMAERAGVSLIPQPAADLTLPSRELNQSHQTIEEWVESHDNVIDNELPALYTAALEREQAETIGVSLIPQPAADLTLSSRELDQSHQTMEEWVNSAEWLEWHENMVNEELLALYTASREREQGG
ncbi:hypothetical protein E4U56_002107 [Claviceps arundinis]|uniref:Myb-like domain-containing protein n=1 Tax=Claviceps arundinis TaxID=1623583 RepID=A0A9P7MQC4_9HYPO|nr:hypothetical protein E4U56_002107 [Claviceps arundinis]